MPIEVEQEEVAHGLFRVKLRFPEKRFLDKTQAVFLHPQQFFGRLVGATKSRNCVRSLGTSIKVDLLCVIRLSYHRVILGAYAAGLVQETSGVQVANLVHHLRFVGGSFMKLIAFVLATSMSLVSTVCADGPADDSLNWDDLLSYVHTTQDNASSWRSHDILMYHQSFVQGEISDGSPRSHTTVSRIIVDWVSEASFDDHHKNDF